MFPRVIFPTVTVFYLRIYQIENQTATGACCNFKNLHDPGCLGWLMVSKFSLLSQLNKPISIGLFSMNCPYLPSIYHKGSRSIAKSGVSLPLPVFWGPSSWWLLPPKGLSFLNLIISSAGN